MANYLPVLLVSVSTHAPVPDDSALSTQPRAQVDYLSHDWQEEDVWRSWRNMTRQKNEIANGVRLENASWRTWWKQRNKLKTVSPETLNWLKDSDVTWLYGPLHTAVEWTPPPKPQPVPDTVDTDPASAHDRLDLSSGSKQLRPPQPQPAKPILKHRSISQFLTSDLPPTSPIFSPVESEDENDDPLSLLSHPLSSKAKGKRPIIPHTKSDTHIARWGPNRAFRKDSPPRIDPPGFDSHAAVPSSSSDSHHLSAGGSIRQSLSQDSNSSGSGGVSSERGSHSHHGQKKKHISFNTFVEQCIAIEKPKKNASGFFGAVDEGAWMGSRHGLVDDDGYEEDQEDSEEEAAAAAAAAQGVEWHRSSHGEEEGGGALGIRSDSEEEDEDEDEDEEDGVIEMRSSTSYRPSSHTPKKKPSHRSQSKVSTTSSSSSTSTATSSSSASSHSTSNTTSSPSGSLSPSRRTSSSSSHLNRKSSVSSSGTAVPYVSSTSTSPSGTQAPIDPYAARAWRTGNSNTNSTYRPSAYRRPPLIRTPSDQPVHVTIAPIAPTILKTTGAWAEGFGDEGGASDDGFAGWGWGIGGASGVIGGSEKDKKDRKRGGNANGSGYGSGGGGSGGYKPGAFGTGTGKGGGSRFDDVDDGQISEGTPVELVYVPPFGSNYSLGLGEYDEPLDGPGTGPRGYPGYVDDDAEEEDIEEELGDAVYHHHHTAGVDGIGFVPEPSFSQPITIGGKNVPSVVINTSSSNVSSSRRRQPQDIEEEEDPYDFFRGPDFGEDYYARRGGRGYSAYERSSGAGSTSSSTTKTSDRDRADRDVRASARQRDRERERWEVGNGEERQSRSRSRSHSRTPSPAFVSSPIVEGGATAPASASSNPNTNANANPSIGGGGSSSSLASSSRCTGSGSSALASNPSSRQGSSSDLLAPPSRGREPSSSNGARPQPQQRGRSSTRTPSSSSSSWERERGANVGNSPMGSLSPDGVPRAATGGPASLGATSGISAGIGAVLAGSGRVERGDRDRERDSRGSDRERGRERRGRERTSGKVLSASEAALLGESSGSLGRRNGAAGAVVAPADPAPVSNTSPIGPIAMDASFSSTTSTCSSTSNSTIMGPPTVVPSLQDEEEYPVGLALDDQAQSAAEAQDAEESAELRYMRMAEEELNRIRTIPTPSNSPVLEMRMVAAVFVHENGNGGSGNSTSPSNSANTSTGTTTPTGSTATGTTSPPPPSELSGVKGVDSVASNASNPVLSPTPVAGGISASQPNPTSSTLSSSGSSLAPSPAPAPAPAPAPPTPNFAASPIFPSKLRPPPLIPTPPLPAKPSTSFTAVSSPRTPGSSGLTSTNSRGHGHSPSPSIESISAGANTPSTPSTIVGKAVDMMSNAGAYFRLWSRESAAASTTSTPAL